MKDNIKSPEQISSKPLIPVSIILPLFNNEKSLPELILRLKSSLNHGDFEIVGIDDCGQDSSSETLLECASAAHIPCRTIHHDQNKGQHASVILGLLSAQGENCVVMDADLQDAPESVPVLLNELEKSDSELVFARRLYHNQSKIDAFTSKTFKTLYFKFLGVNAPADIGLFFAIRREKVNKLFQHVSNKPYVPGLLLRSGLRTAYVQCRREHNRAGQSGYTLRSRTVLALNAVQQAINKHFACLRGKDQ